MKVVTDDVERFIGRYSIGRDSSPLDITGSPHFLRIKVPGGFITSEQLRGISELAERYSRGVAEITDRQDIQLHWIRAEDALDIFGVLDKVGFTTDMCGQGFIGARYGDIRNIMCCPVSGIDKDEILNGYPLVKELSSFFVGNPDFLDLPRKFKISISGCGTDCTRAVINDLALVSVKKGDDVGFTLLVGGSVGASLPGPRLAKPTAIFVRPEEAFKVVVAVAEIFRDHGNRESKTKARFKWLIENWGIGKFLSILEEKLGKTLERYNGPIFQRWHDHEGIQLQSQEGYYYVNIPIMGGRISGQEMVLVSNLAEKYGSGELRLTPTQNIIIPNVKEKEALIKHLADMNFSFDVPKLRWTCIGCASDFCGKTLSPHSKEVLKDIVEHLEKHFSKEILDEARFRIHVSGCPNNCCSIFTAEIGLSGKLSKEGDKIRQTYDIYLGGGLGLEISGKLIEEKVFAEELKYKIASLISNYLRKRNRFDTLRDFCNRHSSDELRMFLKQPIP